MNIKHRSGLMISLFCGQASQSRIQRLNFLIQTITKFLRIFYFQSAMEISNYMVKKIFLSKLFLPLTLLLVLNFAVLKDMPQMIVQGEGFYWLTTGQQNNFWNSIPSSLANF